MAASQHLLILRRQMLRALEAASPAPLEQRDLLDSLPLLDAAGLDEARRELRLLESVGYIVNANRANPAEPWWQITADGLLAIRREHPDGLSAHLFGPQPLPPGA